MLMDTNTQATETKAQFRRRWNRMNDAEKEHYLYEARQAAERIFDRLMKERNAKS